MFQQQQNVQIQIRCHVKGVKSLPQCCLSVVITIPSPSSKLRTTACGHKTKMMVNSNITYYGDLLSGPSARSNRHLMAALCERIINLFSFNPCSCHDEAVQLQSALNDDYNKCFRESQHLPLFRAKN